MSLEITDVMKRILIELKIMNYYIYCKLDDEDLPDPDDLREAWSK